MSVVTNNIQLGSSLTATQNFTITAEAADGTMKLARGNAGATTQDILTVDVSGNIALSGSIVDGVLGAGQTWQDLSGSRALGTTYTNTTGTPIFISIVIVQGSAGVCALTVQGIVVGRTFTQSAAFSVMTAVIPDGATYSCASVSGAHTINAWAELR